MPVSQPYLRAQKALKAGTATKRRAEVVSVRRDEHLVAIDGFDGILFRTKIVARGKGNGKTKVAAGEIYDVVVSSTGEPPRMEFIQWIVVNDDNAPISPPYGCPCRFEPVPIHSEFALHQAVRAVVGAGLSDESVAGVAYLIRKAHGQGLARRFMLENES